MLLDFDLTPVSALFEDWFPDVTESFSALQLYIYFTASKNKKVISSVLAFKHTFLGFFCSTSVYFFKD